MTWKETIVKNVRFYNIELTCLINIVSGLHGRGFLRCSTGDHVAYWLIRGTGVLKKEGQSVKEWFQVDILKAIRSFKNV